MTAPGSAAATIEAMLAEAGFVAEQVSRSDERRHFVVVYQYGKVASTSITLAFCDLEHVLAVQAHFLGRDSVIHELDALLDPDGSDYEQLQMTGQLVRSIAISREIEAFRRGMRRDVQLSIITPVRHPVDWWRSAIMQDIQWHLPFLHSISRDSVEYRGDDASAIAIALPILFERPATMLKSVGGIDSFVDQGLDYDGLYGWISAAERGARFHNLVSGFLRPFGWLDEHFSPYLEIRLDEMETIRPYLLRARLGWGTAYLLRYEDVGTAMGVIAEDMGLADGFVLRRENVSEGRELDGVIRRSFQSSEIDRLRALSAATSYSRRFGYA